MLYITCELKLFVLQLYPGLVISVSSDIWRLVRVRNRRYRVVARTGSHMATIICSKTIMLSDIMMMFNRFIRKRTI